MGGDWVEIGWRLGESRVEVGRRVGRRVGADGVALPLGEAEDDEAAAGAESIYLPLEKEGLVCDDRKRDARLDVRLQVRGGGADGWRRCNLGGRWRRQTAAPHAASGAWAAGALVRSARGRPGQKPCCVPCQARPGSGQGRGQWQQTVAPPRRHLQHASRPLSRGGRATKSTAACPPPARAAAWSSGRRGAALARRRARGCSRAGRTWCIRLQPLVRGVAGEEGVAAGQ